MTRRFDPDVDGSWPLDALQRAFVDGAKFWEFQKTGATLWQSDRDVVATEAERRYGPVPDFCLVVNPQPGPPVLCFKAKGHAGPHGNRQDEW